jgi:hypothetical protein
LPSSLFVLVEPLATVETVEEYLVERLKGRTIETESGTENTPTEMSSMSTSNREQLSELARQQSGDDYETTTSSIEPESVELIDPNELSTSPSPSHFIFTEKKPMESKELKETQSKKSEAETEEEFPANMKRRKLKSSHSRRMRRKQQQQLAFESQTTNVTSAPQSGESHLRDSDSDSEEPEVTQREMLFTEPRVEHGAPAVPSGPCCCFCVCSRLICLANADENSMTQRPQGKVVQTGRCCRRRRHRLRTCLIPQNPTDLPFLLCLTQSIYPKT